MLLKKVEDSDDGQYEVIGGCYWSKKSIDMEACNKEPWGKLILA